MTTRARIQPSFDTRIFAMGGLLLAACAWLPTASWFPL